MRLPFKNGDRLLVPIDGPKSNKVLQATFDPLRTFAFAKARIASNAPEHRRWASTRDSNRVTET